MTPAEQTAYLEQLRQQLANAPNGVDVSALAAALDALQNPAEDRTMIWFLLDRSGSMKPLAEDVIGGFNSFISEQAPKPGKARLTAVQFDGQNAFEIIHDAQRVTAIPELTNSTYWARGITPLYDAIGALIDRADQRIVQRAAAGKPIEDQLVLIFTDGLENASRRYGRAKVFELIRQRQEDNWTFVFMGANQDSYAESGRIGFVAGNVQDYDATPDSVGHAFESMSRATAAWRAKPHSRRVSDKERFFNDLKEAELAKRRR